MVPGFAKSSSHGSSDIAGERCSPLCGGGVAGRQTTRRYNIQLYVRYEPRSIAWRYSIGVSRVALTGVVVRRVSTRFQRFFSGVPCFFPPQIVIFVFARPGRCQPPLPLPRALVSETGLGRVHPAAETDRRLRGSRVARSGRACAPPLWLCRTAAD